MDAIFRVNLINGNPDVPPQDSHDGGLQLAYLNADGERTGGFCTIAEPEDGKMVIQINSTPETIAVMKMQPEQWTWVRDMETFDESYGGEKCLLILLTYPRIPMPSSLF